MPQFLSQIRLLTSAATRGYADFGLVERRSANAILSSVLC